MPETMQVHEILKGYVVNKDNIQSVGNMTVIPIISDVEFTNVADVNDVTLHRDPEYGKLEFHNSGGNVGVVLQGWTMIDSKQHAQDRTVPYAQLVKAGANKIAPANCIQTHQSGHFNCSQIDQDSFMILPPTLRSVALKNSTHRSAEYSALWETLSTWSRSVNCREQGLQTFYSKHQDKLDQFVAQFEPVEKQLGAVTMINGQIIAIDIMPKYDTWKKTWRALVRDSYGAEAVRQAEDGKATDVTPSLDMSGINTIDDLITAYTSMKDDFYTQLQSAVDQMIHAPIVHKTLDDAGELTMLKLDNEKFTGQGVIHGDNHFVYLSLVSTQGKYITVKKFKSLRIQPYTNSSFTFS